MPLFAPNDGSMTSTGMVGAADAPPKKWVFEGPTPAALMKGGWTKESINVGEKITFVGNPSRGGSAFALLKEVVTAGGKHLATGIKLNVGAKGAEY